MERRAGADRFQVAIDLAPPLHQVVVHLQPEEEPLGETEISRESQISVCGDVTLAQHDLVDTAGGDMNGARQRILAQRHRLQKILQQDFAGVRVVKQPALIRGSRRFRHAPVLLHPKRSKCAIDH
jgi:hypothetical protein